MKNERSSAIGEFPGLKSVMPNCELQEGALLGVVRDVALVRYARFVHEVGSQNRCELQYRCAISILGRW